MKDDLQWMTTFGGRRPSVEDDLWWKKTYGGRRPLVEDDLLWKTTFSGRRLLVEDDPCMLPSPLWGIFKTRSKYYHHIGATCWPTVGGGVWRGSAKSPSLTLLLKPFLPTFLFKVWIILIYWRKTTYYTVLRRMSKAATETNSGHQNYFSMHFK